MINKTYIVAINALSGGGKTTITKELEKSLDNTKALYFDDRDYDSDSGITDIGRWLEEGADANQFNLDLLVEDIEQLLKQGLDVIVLDYPFGRRHDKIAKYIDIAVFIDTPLDIALGRRLLRDYKGNLEDKIFQDINFYLREGRKIYLKSREIAINDDDFIIDGSRSLEYIIKCIKSEIDKQS